MKQGMASMIVQFHNVPLMLTMSNDNMLIIGEPGRLIVIFYSTFYIGFIANVSANSLYVTNATNTVY